MRKNTKSNQNLVRLIHDLKVASKEHEAPIWRDIAKRLEKPRRNWAEVNIGKIARFAGEKEVVVVPGTLLGTGDITIPVTVASFKASKVAEEKIAGAGGRAITIRQLVEENPKGSAVRIMG